MKNQKQKYLVLGIVVVVLVLAVIYIYSADSIEKPKITISNEQEANKISKNISDDLGSVKSTLDDIENKLG